jgi:hypothetical protein
LTFIVVTAPYPSNLSKAISQNSLLVKMIARDLQPISIVENLGFREFVRGLDPKYNLPSRSLISETLLPGTTSIYYNNYFFFDKQ